MTMAQEPQQPQAKSDMNNISEPAAPHPDASGTSETPSSQSYSSPSDWHKELKVFEADRRTKYNSNLESLTLYWKSHCDLLETSVHETTRAYRLVLGVSKAHERMATTLASSSVSASASAPNEQQQQQPQRQEQHLSSLEEANATMIQHFGGSATTMKTNVASSLYNLLQTIQSTQQQVSKEGKQMLNVLDRHEAQVEQAWDACFEASAASLRPSRNCPQSFAGETPSAPVDDSLGSPKSKSPRAGISRIISCGDPWLAEFQYRSCLASLEEVWEAKCTELYALFATVCDAECMRRINLRESMILFVRQQQNPFMDVEDTQATALTDWVEKETSQQEVQEHVQATIRREMEALGGSIDDMNIASPTDGNEQAGSPTTDRNKDDMAVYRQQFTPVSPLESDYLLDAFVLEQREPDGSKIVLAVVTSDSFLHLFEIASDRIELSSSPEEAFQALLPMQDPPSVGKTLESSPVWNGSLKPSRTLDLDHCSVSLVREDTVVDIFETTSTHGSVNRVRLAVSFPRERSTFAAAIQRGPAGA